jgi:acetyl-CoA carboxylase biotin carboxyl carrier protein
MAGNDIKGKVKALYEIMKDEKIQELEVNSKDYTLFIKRKDPNEGERQVIVKKTPSAPAQIELSAQTTQTQRQKIDKETVKSPITGVFYQSPSPSMPSFVNVGDIVEIGKPLCIIEAMKVMNEIKATVKAKILKITAENGKPVNSGQDLFEIETL